MMQLAIACIFLLAFFFTSEPAQSPKWKGKIEYKDAVKVIGNPLEPLYGKIALELVEDLCIGNDNDENYLFYKVRDIEVDKAGYIYVLDSGNYRVQKFDPKGMYVKTIGRKGQGPGEFERPVHLILNHESGHLYVNDFIKIEVFDNEGDYQNRVSLTSPSTNLVIHEKEECYWTNLPVFQRANFDFMKYAFSKINFQGEVLQEHETYSMGNHIKKRNDGLYVAIFSGYEHKIHFAELDSNSLVYGYSGEYKLHVIDIKGDTVFDIKKDEQIRQFSAEEKEEYKDAPLPDFKPFFHNIVTDDEGRIYVQRSIRKISRNYPREFDVYSKEGYFIYSTILPYSPHVIRGGFLYTLIAREETSEEFVKRFRIENWDQIKAGIN